MSITTVPQCKAFRGIESENTEHDAELDRLIQAVQSYLEKECERKFDQATVTEYYSGLGTGNASTTTQSNFRSYESGMDSLVVARPPIVSITNIWDDMARAYATPIPSANYVIEDADKGIIRLDRLRFQQGLRNIKIIYIGGFATIPSDLEQAAIEMVWAAREKGVHNLVGVRSRSIADGNVQYLNLGWGSLAQDIVQTYSLHTGVA